MELNQSSFTRLKSNKSSMIRSSSDNKSLSEAAKVKEAAQAQQKGQQAPELKEGQIIRGQVVDVRYNEVKIRLEPGSQVVTAKLSGDVALSIGQEAQFQISELSSDKLVLKYMPDTSGVSTNSSVLKALTYSGFPLTDRNKAIVEELFNHTLPVDKQTLQNLIKLSHTNREASPLTLVLMYKNNLPMTPSNIKQFEAYQQGTNQLVGDIHTIIKQLVEQLNSNNTKTSDPETPPLSNTAITQDANESTSTQSNNQGIQLNDKLLTILCGKSSEPYDKDQMQANTLPASISLQHPLADQNNAEGIIEYDKLHTSPNNPASTLFTEDIALDVPFPLSQVLSLKEQTTLSDYLGAFLASEALHETITQGTATVKDVLTFLQNAIPKAEEAMVSRLLASTEYQKLLGEAFHQKWTITPEKLSKKDSVKELFQSLEEDMEKLTLLIKPEVVSEQTQKLSNPVDNLQDNLRFMKDLNELFTYLQLPIQLKDQDVHSELYIFTRKRALQEKDNLSVLLHLDMANLGPLNIHVQMTHHTISAKFYLEDSQGEQLITQYMPSLSEALSKKGYHLYSEVINSYTKPDFSKDFIEDSAGDNPVKRYTFDIRT